MDLARFIAELSFRWRKRFPFSQPPEENPAKALGRRGERLAARFLKRQRYKILYRNYRGPNGGEIDLVCRHKDTLVFVEVKTRHTLNFGDPASAVDLKKQRLIARGALAWLRLLDFPEIAFRFDIVEVLFPPSGAEFHLLQNAFEMPEPLLY